MVARIFRDTLMSVFSSFVLTSYVRIMIIIMLIPQYEPRLFASFS